MEENEELQLRAKIHKLNADYKLARLALILGWLPFVIFAFVLLIVVGVVFSASRGLFGSGTGGAIFFTLVVYSALIYGLVMFYVIVFRRRAKIVSELSLSKAKLEMVVDENVIHDQTQREP